MFATFASVQHATVLENLERHMLTTIDFGCVSSFVGIDVTIKLRIWIVHKTCMCVCVSAALIHIHTINAYKPLSLLVSFH